MTDMKKITRLTALLLCACLLLSFAACNKEENKKAKSTTPTTNKKPKQREYTAEQLNSLFDNIEEIEI